MAKQLKVRITFTEDLLGSSPSDPEIYERFVASKAETAEKTAEEVASIGGEISEEESEASAVTVFGRIENTDTPFIWDYQIRGFFKNAAKAMYQVGGDSKLTSFKTKIDNLVFIKERKIPLNLPDGEEITFCQRPLRAQTAKGERIALACSESVPAGTTAEFTVVVLQNALMKHVIEWLDYGYFNGLGQWHNSGKGRFEWKDISDEMDSGDRTDQIIATMFPDKKKDKEEQLSEEKEAEEQPVKKKRGRPKKDE